MYNLWIGKKILIHWQTSLGVMLYVLSMTFGSIYVNILNGLGQLKTQFNISIVTMILFIPMCYFFAIYLKFGLIGISISLVIANVNGLIAAPIELKKLLKDNLSIK
jgi:Na+-driven multidrug efflux pump